MPDGQSFVLIIRVDLTHSGQEVVLERDENNKFVCPVVGCDQRFEMPRKIQEHNKSHSLSELMNVLDYLNKFEGTEDYADDEGEGEEDD